MSLTPLTTSNSDSANINQVNDIVRQINNEQQTKVFYGPNNVQALVTGRLPNDLGYGIQFSDASGIPRIIAYIDANNNPVFKISESGVNVTTAGDDELLLNSAQNVFKIVQSGTGTLSVPASMASLDVATETISHGLGYKPAFMCFITGGDAYGTSSSQVLMMPFSSPVIVAGTIRGFMYADAYTTTSNFVFRWSNNTTITEVTGGSINFKYYLLQETAT